MHAGRRATRRVRVLAAGALALAVSSAGVAGEGPPPTAERVQLDEQAGRVEEALTGWAARAVDAATPAERGDALRHYVALASKNAAAADAWLTDSVSRSGAGLRVIAGRRVVVVAPDDAVGTMDVNALAAQLDAYALAIQRLTGARAPQVQLAKTDKRPQDAAGRFVVGVWPIPKPLADQAFDAWRNSEDPKAKGTGLAYDIAWSLAQASLGAAANKRAQMLGAAPAMALHDLAARVVGDAAGTALADETRKLVKEAFEKHWAPGCLPAEAAPADTVIVHLFFGALDAGRAAGRDPGEALRAFLGEPRRDFGWGGRRIASARESAFEPLLGSFTAPEALAGFRQAGVLPVGPELDEMQRRVAAEDQCREAESLRSDSEGTAARMFRAAADSLGESLIREELILEALSIEERTEAKKARASAQKLGLIEGFEFLGPLPDTRPKDNAPVAQRLMPLAVATASGRVALKVKEPAEVSLKWDEVKDVYDHLVQRTPWSDKKGTTWGGGTVAAIRWTKDMGRVLRIRPCRDGWSDVCVLADGRPAERWPDGSFLVPGAKGTEVVLTSGGRITCSLPWRDAKCVDADLAAANAADAAVAVLTLRPWAARHVAAALPAIVAALTKLADAEFQRHVVLLAPYHGGDAAVCDAMLAHAKAHPAVLAAYLDVCRGTRDAAVLDRLVALASAEGAQPATVAGVRAVLETTLFRKLPETAPALAAFWERGKKWLAATGAAEGEDVRDLLDSWPCFRPAAGASASGRACLAPSGAGRGEGYVCVDVPEASGPATLSVRWRAGGAGRLMLHGTVTDGRKSRAFSIDAPAPAAAADGPAWSVDSFDLGAIPRGRVVISLEDPCASGCEIDAIAVGAKPLE